MLNDNVKVDVEYYTASWIGKSAIQVNGTWYYAGEKFDWVSGPQQLLPDGWRKLGSPDHRHL